MTGQTTNWYVDSSQILDTAEVSSSGGASGYVRFRLPSPSLNTHVADGTEDIQVPEGTLNQGNQQIRNR